MYIYICACFVRTCCSVVQEHDPYSCSNGTPSDTSSNGHTWNCTLHTHSLYLYGLEFVNIRTLDLNYSPCFSIPRLRFPLDEAVHHQLHELPTRSVLVLKWFWTGDFGQMRLFDTSLFKFKKPLFSHLQLYLLRIQPAIWTHDGRWGRNALQQTSLGSNSRKKCQYDCSNNELYMFVRPMQRVAR